MRRQTIYILFFALFGLASCSDFESVQNRKTKFSFNPKSGNFCFFNHESGMGICGQLKGASGAKVEYGQTPLPTGDAPTLMVFVNSPNKAYFKITLPQKLNVAIVESNYRPFLDSLGLYVYNPELTPADSFNVLQPNSDTVKIIVLSDTGKGLMAYTPLITTSGTHSQKRYLLFAKRKPEQIAELAQVLIKRF